jgi:hypothetical protein
MLTLLPLQIDYLISIGCALSAPDGSSPRGYVWRLVVKHRLKVQLLFLLWTSYYLASPRVQVEVSIPCNHSLLFFVFFLRLILSSALCRILISIVYGPCFSTKAQQYVLINKAPSSRGKTLIRFLLRRIIFSSHLGFS